MFEEIHGQLNKLKLYAANPNSKEPSAATQQAYSSVLSSHWPTRNKKKWMMRQLRPREKKWQSDNMMFLNWDLVKNGAFANLDVTTLWGILLVVGIKWIVPKLCPQLFPKLFWDFLSTQVMYLLVPKRISTNEISLFGSVAQSHAYVRFLPYGK